MKYKHLFALLFFSLLGTIYAQDKVTLSGSIIDQTSNETLFGVNIYFPDLKTGATTNEYGFYSITIPQGTHRLYISYMGYTTIDETITITESSQKNYLLASESNSLEEVVISSNNQKLNVRKPEMSVSKLSVNTIKKMPAVMGEVDVIKSILQVPGVSIAQEGASGFNVRGGSVDGNLVLLDEAIVYSTSHLFGFFSVFNSDVIKNLTLYKGGIPANYGGRSSSVLDIYQKDGNKQEYHASGGIGVISSRLMVEGPIDKGKSSFVVAGRSSYAHLFLELADEPNTANFYDLNAKLNYTINENNNIYASGYFGNDKLDFNNNFINTYGNSLFNLRWNHIFSDKLFSNVSAIYSKYDYGFELGFIGIDWDSDIQNYNLKYDLKHYLSNALTLEYGLNSLYYSFNPGTINPLDDSSGIIATQLKEKYAFENAIYINAEHKLSDKLSLNYGLRYSNFQRLGKENVNIYQDNQAVVFNEDFQVYEGATPVDTRFYDSNESIASFDNLEPRLSVAFTLNDSQSIKASYNRMNQYIHLISNTASVSPLDIWAPSDQFLKPETSDQIALGYFRNIKDGDYSLEVETFYKTTQNKADYIDGADLVANDNIEQVLLIGEARSYGIEVLAKKNIGKLTGWLSYTLSKTEQRTPGRTSTEPGINDGNWYRANYDRRHNLSLTTAYELNNKWNFGGIFTYQTGRAATFPNGKYEYQGIAVPTFGSRNENSLTDYHHLDLSATYTPKPNKSKGWQGEWVFTLYNVYNRSNAASFNFGQNTDSGLSEARRTSIFGIIPSITYNFKF